MMKSYKLLSLILVILLSTSCEREKDANFILKGTVKDLKKGVVFLQRLDDSTIVNLDSVEIKGQPDFTLQTNLDEPLLLYLSLQKKDGLDHYIPFFADKGVTEIKTTLKDFSTDAKIIGSKQQELLEQYLKLMSDFRDKNLDLIKANFEAIKKNDSIRSDSILKKSDRLEKLKYASTINFALNNSDSEVAAYLALYEIPNTSIKYLDSIYNNLTGNIKQSYYGKTLNEAIESYRVALDSIPDKDARGNL